MKFITDGMLGKLTRWLRLLGFDVEYANDMEDKKLMTIAKKEKRILLTRDLELFQQANAHSVDAFLVEGRTEAERLACMAKKYKFPLEIDITVSRCPKCNAQIKPVDKDSVADKVEKATFTYYNEFWQCPNCAQIYWQGAHWKRIANTLDEAKKTLDSISQCGDLK
ncbi:MAG TPA: Mut7-C RNAse domain-containing protein [Candidatus Krumholzibacteriaceae bacterium]|nr:Mut7-C RNAse domain-containing protein [Candidatus Krumholzibacteriaceae bacterium]